MTRNGFTLVELLVALSIFGLLSAAGVGLLASGVEARQRSVERLDANAAVLRGNALLTADLAQAAPRLHRRADGVTMPAFSSDGDRLLALVRRGWANEDGEARSSLQRVEYRLADGQLVRTAYPAVDGARPGPDAILMDGVQAAALRFRFNGEWRERWDAARPELLPDAVELQLTLAGGRELRQLFIVGAGRS